MKCAKDQVMSWDQGLSYTARPMKWGRGAVLAAFYLLVTAAEFLVTDRAIFPLIPRSRLTAEQAVENYNWYEETPDRASGDYTQDLSEQRRELGGPAPSAYVSWSQWIELEKGAGEWSPVRPDSGPGWPRDRMERDMGRGGQPLTKRNWKCWSGHEHFVPLLFALAPEAGEGSFLPRALPRPGGHR